MRLRPALPLFLSVLGLAACADGPEIATPTTGVPPAFTLDAGAVCDGTGVPAVECGALVDLYHSTGGDDRIGRTGRGTDPNPCGWSGVTCTEQRAGWRLSGASRRAAEPDPSEADLPSLAVLAVDESELSGRMSETFAAFAETLAICAARPGNTGLYVPDLQAYRDVDTGDRTICEIPLASAEDIGEDAVGGSMALCPPP